MAAGHVYHPSSALHSAATITLTEFGEMKMKIYGMFPLTAVALFCLAASANAEEKQDIVDTAVAADGFETLVAAVKAGGLVETLKGDGPFTVFAPTDEAFAKLPKGTLEELLKPENKQKLAGILTYHVVPGKVMAADVVKVSEAKTAQGSAVEITVKNGKVYVDEAQVIKTDIACSNGVIHVIDAVILPE